WHASDVFGPGMSSFGADAERLYFGQRSPGSNPPLYALNSGGEGDLSPAKGATELKNQAWSQGSASPNMASPVAADGLLYVVADNVLTCRDASAGEQLYKERVPDLASVAASPIIIGEQVLLLDEEGAAALVEA